MSFASPPESREWLEADGLGGFASGTAAGVRTRRYHALLLVATTPPTGRVVLVNGLEAWMETPNGAVALSTQRYAPDVVHPDGASRIAQFEHEPWPRWKYRIDDRLLLSHELFVRNGATVLTWKLARSKAAENGAGPIVLCVRPLLSGRDYHALHHQNGSFGFEPRAGDGTWTWQAYPGVPAVVAAANAGYEHAPQWYRNFLYTEEQARGLDAIEDLASPGVLRFDLSEGEAILVLSAGEPKLAVRDVPKARNAERRRRAAFASALDRAADAYLVGRGMGKTIVAGYPWFTDWGRDTFIALRGICMATGRYQDARAILLEWADQVSDGMLPNRFADGGETAEFNSVDASLWYVIAVRDLALAAGQGRCKLSRADRAKLEHAIEAILQGYTRGTRYGIRMDSDGLLACGEPGVQLTWMDAKVGDWVVTPRIGKPVEVQALWLNALAAASLFSPRWRTTLGLGMESFGARFWNAERDCLYDVVDCDHVAGAVDDAVRPNQIFAAGGLPLVLLDRDRAANVVSVVERELWTPLGLRSLGRGAADYRGRYAGGVVERDGAYHQGTVWPWLAGPFVEAWLRVRDNTAAARLEARSLFVVPLLAHLTEAGLGHVSEVAGGDAPHRPGGCPFQAWSVGELLRLERVVLEESAAGAAV